MGLTKPELDNFFVFLILIMEDAWHTVLKKKITFNTRSYK